MIKYRGENLLQLFIQQTFVLRKCYLTGTVLDSINAMIDKHGTCKLHSARNKTKLCAHLDTL